MNPRLTAREAGAADLVDWAVQVERWLKLARTSTRHGLAWSTDPHQPRLVRYDLYNGFPGIILFLIELYHATNDESYRQQAIAGALELVANLRECAHERCDLGLYTGMAGAAFALQEALHASGGDARLLSAIRHAHDALKRARLLTRSPLDEGGSTDVFGGSAGTGIYLLHAAQRHDDPALVEAAVQIGMRLLDVGQQVRDGLKWVHSASRGAFLNFSHGVSGIGYFLASLSQATGDRRFLDAALAAARYLDSLAHTEGDAWIAPADDSQGRDTFFGNWCHGPPGTARFFYRLAEAAGDPAWMNHVHAAATATTRIGIAQYGPARWHRVSQCCGSAGVGDFFLSLHRTHPRDAYLDAARLAVDHVCSRATLEANRIRWVLARNRSDRRAEVTQTGFMQGAAGAGMFLLRMDGFRRGRRPVVAFPDNPFPTP